MRDVRSMLMELDAKTDEDEYLTVHYPHAGLRAVVRQSVAPSTFDIVLQVDEWHPHTATRIHMWELRTFTEAVDVLAYYINKEDE